MMDEFERHQVEELVRALGEIASIQQCSRCNGSGVGPGGFECPKCEGHRLVPLLDGWEAQQLAQEVLALYLGDS